MSSSNVDEFVSRLLALEPGSDVSDLARLFRRVRKHAAIVDMQLLILWIVSNAAPGEFGSADDEEIIILFRRVRTLSIVNFYMPEPRSVATVMKGVIREKPHPDLYLPFLECVSSLALAVYWSVSERKVPKDVYDIYAEMCGEVFTGMHKRYEARPDFFTHDNGEIFPSDYIQIPAHFYALDPKLYVSYLCANFNYAALRTINTVEGPTSAGEDLLAIRLADIRKRAIATGCVKDAGKWIIPEKYKKLK